MEIIDLDSVTRFTEWLPSVDDKIMYEVGLCALINNDAMKSYDNPVVRFITNYNTEFKSNINLVNGNIAIIAEIARRWLVVYEKAVNP